MPRPEFPALADRLYFPFRQLSNLLWRLAGLQNWTHYFMPTGHDRSCPHHYKPLEHCLCWGGVDLRTKQQSREGRFYLKSHLAIWLFGIRWYDFWRYKSYAAVNLGNAVEKLLVPSRYEEHVWADAEPPDDIYDNHQDPMYDDYPYDEPEPLEKAQP